MELETWRGSDQKEDKKQHDVKMKRRMGKGTETQTDRVTLEM